MYYIKTCRKRVLIGSMEIKKLRRTLNYISCVFIGCKNVFGPITVLVTNRFRLEQKSYLPLKLQFMSGFGKTTMFNGLLGNRPDVFCWASDYLIWSGFWSPEKDISRIWRLGDRPFQALLREIHIKIFSSETTGPIATNLWWNGPWMAPFQNCVW